MLSDCTVVDEAVITVVRKYYFYKKVVSQDGHTKIQNCVSDYELGTQNVKQKRGATRNPDFFPVYCLFCLKKYAASNPVIFTQT